MSARRLPST